jgi:predicted extracellular nuclease
VTVDDPGFTITCSASGVHTATVTGGPTTWTLDPDADFALDETCTVTITASAVHDSDPNDPPDTMATDFTFHVSTPAPPLRIHEIQGAGHLSPKTGVNVNGVEGVVTLKTSNGFFMQDPQPDSDPATSEGIFVFGSRSAGLVAVGDLVRVNGQARVPRLGQRGDDQLPVTEIGNTSIGDRLAGIRCSRRSSEPAGPDDEDDATATSSRAHVRS